MLAEERRIRVVRALDDAGTLSTDELARQLDVSPETIRRDLVQLEQQGVLRRVHGGATRAPGLRGEEPTFLERAESAADAKRRIGLLAAGTVSPGQTLAFDVGTTSLAVARALPITFHGTVVTCSLLVASELAGRPGLEVLVTGGRVRGGDLAVSNAQAIAYLHDIHADVAFLGSGGISAEAGVTDFHLDEVATRRVLIVNSAASYLLADSTKFGRVAAHRVCGFEDLTGIISDEEPPPGLRRAIVDAGAQVIHPGEPLPHGRARVPDDVVERRYSSAPDRAGHTDIRRRILESRLPG
jgi:DeoR family transcriptional regulator, fructose operon transcriptional repressor